MIIGSVGIVFFFDDGQIVFELLCKVDVVMYWVKEEGYNIFCFFFLEINIVMFDELLLENDFYGVFDWGELQMYYQFKVDV